MDTRMIDVAIGLALVFALTSLLVTALQELWTSHRGLRREFLKKAVASFFGDDSTFAAALLKHPTIAALAQGEAPTGVNMHSDKGWKGWGPSYLSSDVLVSALFGYLVQHHFAGVRPDTPGELVRALQPAGPTAQGKPPLPNQDFIDALRSLAQGVEQDWPAFEKRVQAWYAAVSERSTGWFKRHVQGTVFVIAVVVAMVVNINPVVIASRLWQDEPLRKAMVKLAEDASANDKAPAGNVTPSQPAPDPAATPGPAPAANPARWADVKDPALQRKVLATSSALTNQVDAYGRTLFASVDDPGLRPRAEDLKKIAYSFIALRTGLDQLAAQPPGSDPAQAYALLGELEKAIPIDPAFKGLRDLHAPLRQAVTARFAPIALMPEAARPPQTGGAPVKLVDVLECQNVQDATAKNVCTRFYSISELQKAGLPIGWSGSAFPSLFDDSCWQRGTCKHAWQGQVNWGGNVLLLLAGWIITGLACTLGAPFWFDALNKLVQLRGAGRKPETATGTSETSGGVVAAPATTPSTVSALAGPAEPSEPMSDALNDAERALTTDDVKVLQGALGLPQAQTSGYFDRNTRAAIQRWQLARGGTAATGELTADQIRFLQRLPGSDQDGYLA